MSRSSKLKRVYSLPFEGPSPNALFASSLKPPGKPQICWRITKRPSIPDQAISIIKELKNKQQFPVVVKAPVVPPAAHTQPASSPVKDTTSDYYTGSHSDSSANSVVHHSDSFNATKESADESISMSLKKLDLDENTTADVSMSCHNEGESNMLSAVSGFEEEDFQERMSPLDTKDEKEIEDSHEMPSKEMRKHSQYTVEKWNEETRVLSSVKEGPRDVMPPLEDGTNVREKQKDYIMPPLENRLGGRSPKSRKALLLEKYNEIKEEEEKRMNGKSRATGFCPSPQLKENVLETKTAESQAPATLNMLPLVKPTHQSPLKNDQELRTEHLSTFSTPTSIKSASGHSSTFSTPTSIKTASGHSSTFSTSTSIKSASGHSSTFSTPTSIKSASGHSSTFSTSTSIKSASGHSSTFSTSTSIKSASGHSSTFSTPTSTKSNRKLKLAASFCGAKNTVDNSKRHPSTCPAVLRSRSAMDTQQSIDASTSQLVSSSQQQSDPNTCVLQEQIRSMEQKIGAMENELSEILSNSEEDLPLWDEERLTTLDQFILLKIKSGMKARFIQQRSTELSKTKYKQHSTSSESDLKLKHSTLQTEERALRTVLQLYYT